ncbi:MAG: hypothetical protein HOO88_06930 [Kiritimatiellaceae bacterium]|nr:hypothetical protein [Kiritimatiellaceae bacterium]
MQSKPKTIVTVIADSNFVIPVYILVLSLKFFEPAQRIHILGISLSAAEKAFFTQFENVFVFDSSIPRSDKPGAMRIIADILKGEALMTAKDCEEPWIALLDGDCIATGNLEPCLAPSEPALYARSRTLEEDDRIFQYYRIPGEPDHGIPRRFLNRWRQDVGPHSEPSRTTTVLSGNLVLHRNYLDFARIWQTFMEKVLVHTDPSKTDVAYYMPAEFALSAWLMFAENPPPVREVLLNSNPDARLVHLGPAPKYWRFWTLKKFEFFNPVIRLLDWAKDQGYERPLLPAALKKRNKALIIAGAFTYEAFIMVRRKIKKFCKRAVGNSPDRQAQRYARQRI